MLPLRGTGTDTLGQNISSMNIAHASADRLDFAYSHLLSEDVYGAMNTLHEFLGDMRGDMPTQEWRAFASGFRSHNLHEVLLQSPFARRSFEKPRGYAGDAALIDLIYGCGPRPDNLTSLGQAIYAWEFDSSGCRSVRHRRVRLAREIDLLAADRRDIRVLAIAAGHLREAELSTALREGRVTLVAMDQDATSLALIQQTYADCGVTPCIGTVRDVIRRKVPKASFDLVYAAGLYDYLADNVAVALTDALLKVVAPGGRLLVANFTPSMRDAGYMEAVMDWYLWYRDESHMLNMLSDSARERLVRIDQSRDPDGNITYLRAICQ